MYKFTLVIGNKNYSSWSMRPWVLMKYLNIPFNEIVIPLFRPESKEVILKYSPSGKVPLLKHGDIHVWDSMAIAEYLADLFPEKGIWPKEIHKRALARSVSAEMHSGFMALRTNCRMDVRTLNKKPKANPLDLQKDIDRIIEIWDNCRRQFHKDGDFLFGHFTIADAMFAPIPFRFQSYGIPVSGEAKRYCEMMMNLPCLHEWVKAAKSEQWVIEGH